MARKKRKNHPAKKEAFTPIPRERALVVREDTFALQKAMTALAAQEKPRRQKKQQRRRRRTGWLIAALLLAGALCTGVFVLDIPHWQQLDPAKLSRLSQTSRLYDASGALVTKLRGAENRTLVSIDQVPLAVRGAFLAAEDLRFYEHHGFDLVRIFGAIVADLKSQSFSQGASTIDQQLVKLTHLSSEKTFARKA